MVLTTQEVVDDAKELARWKGFGLTPNKGCKLVWVRFFDDQILIEVEYFPGDPGSTSGPPEKCYPEEPDEIEVINVLINGKMIDPSGIFTGKQLEKMGEEARQKIIESYSERDAE